MRDYQSYLKDQRRRFVNFDESDLDPRFIPFFDSRQRIKVDDCGMIRFGFVSVSMGWKPVFLLMRHNSCMGSSAVLNKNTKILAKQMSNGKYRNI